MGLLNIYKANLGILGNIPYNPLNDPTNYRNDVNHSESTRGYFAQPGTPPSKFNQTYTPNNTYSDFIKNYI